jgi:hypothetical protein
MEAVTGVQTCALPIYNLTHSTGDGGLVSRTGERYPMVLMQISRSVFTSVCLVLQKPG